MSTSGYAQNLIFQCRAAGLPAPTAEYRFDKIRRWRLDLSWPARKVYAEVDGGIWVGGRHNRGAGYEKDCEKLNAAALAGWRGFRFTTAMVKSGAALNVLRTALEQPERAIGVETR